MEFKAGQPLHVWQDFYKITKDWKEDPQQPIGHYFHLLKAANAGTLPALLDKLVEAFHYVDGCNGEVAPMLITICVLDTQAPDSQWACSFTIIEDSSRWQDNPNQDLNGFGDELRNFKSLQKQKQHISSVWGWSVI